MKYFYLSGKFVSPAQAKISIMTHAFNYGTAVFEGIRAYWNAEQKELYVFRLQDHFKRMEKNCKVLNLSLPRQWEGMFQITLELLRKNKVRGNTYIRPICFQARLGIGPKFGGKSDFAMYLLPLTSRLDSDRAMRILVSSYRRIYRSMIPPGAKINGSYVNSFLAGQEALKKGFDDAILLNLDGTVAEATGMNIFLVKKNQLITPPGSANILAGITRDCVIKLARRELGLLVQEKNISVAELKSADEVFLTGTGAEIAPVGLIDKKIINRRKIGPVTRMLSDLYHQIVLGEMAKYHRWLTPVY
jgi:branched-chain amino acid aminotransferase